ncbi:hypothetical protein RND71_006169 [Anisodus tanguticus]|uniref:Mitochondrial import inner membrane translocase subunit Tim16 n=1 Tax=Anisodus tanguticus TaxID=243964 RepID=A0AAE1SSU3_9SOLA|nr:hypothetical protein RND71_006169 [Anisodus tanguticus]
MGPKNRSPWKVAREGNGPCEGREKEGLLQMDEGKRKDCCRWTRGKEMDQYMVKAAAARILANLLVMGSGIMVRAFAQAYRQALANASKNGVAQEAVQNIKRVSKNMTESEARQILGVAEHSSWEDVLQKYDNLFESNAKNGSFYLQSKVHRAKECLESLYQSKAEGPN